MSYNQISERSARSVRKLYKALLRVGRKWPVSENRRDRSLYEAIPRVTKQRYSILRTGLRPEQVKEYGEKGVAELNSLHNLINNVHLQEYPLKGDYTAKYRTLMAKEVANDLPMLDSRYQAKEHQKYFGGDMTFLSTLFEEKKSAIAAKEEAQQSVEDKSSTNKPL